MKALTFLEIPLRVVSVIALVCIAGFCVFGFLASFELGAISSWHFLYAGCGVGALFVATQLLPWQAKRTFWKPITAVSLFSLAVLLLRLWAVQH